MLQSLDQWAFGVLLALYQLFGIADIPREPSPDWTIIERWTEQPDKSYRLVMESTSLAGKCSLDDSKFIVFPKVFMSGIEVYVNNVSIFTNAKLKKLELSTAVDRPYISCRSIIKGSTVRFEINSYLKFFSSIDSYPKFEAYKPWKHFFDITIYSTAAMICFCLGLIGSAFIKNMKSDDNLMVFLIREFTLTLLMFSYVPGVFFELPTSAIHYLFAVTFSTGFLFFMKPVLIKSYRSSVFFGLFSFNILLWSVCFGQGNLIQLIILFYSIIFIGSLAYMTLLVFQFKKSEIYNFTAAEKTMYFFVFILGALEIYNVDVSRDGYYFLPLLIIVISIINFFNVLKQQQYKNLAFAIVNEKLRHEQLMLSKVSAIFDAHRQLMHDLKSPITSLNFFLSSDKPNRDFLRNITIQISEILNRITGDEIKHAPDWYSVFSLEQVFLSVFDIYKAQHLDKAKFTLKGIEKGSLVEVFYDPIDLRVICEELISNAIKAASNEILDFSVSISSSAENLILSISDSCPSIDASLVSKLGNKGVTVTGSGLGLYSIGEKIKSIGGRLVFASSSNEPKIQLFLKSRCKIFELS